MSSSHQRYHRGQSTTNVLNALAESEHSAATTADAHLARIQELEAKLKKLSAHATVTGSYITLLETDNAELSACYAASQEHNLRITAELETDAKTGLPNERAFKRRLTEELARKQRSPDYQLLLVKVDLDGFKAVNDTYGDKAGDHALQVVGQRLKSVVRTYDLVARPYGDTFYLVVGSVPQISECKDAVPTYRTPQDVLDRAKKAVGEPISYVTPTKNEVSFTVGLTGEGSILDGTQSLDSICEILDTLINKSKTCKYAAAGIERRR
ncbi:MAG TPA: diguanylate cyclase [Candidatus Nanoarchaeia archaeon]|nr:diguanylate cyclase [Candidatus Nanoarchaeia archaeon]